MKHILVVDDERNYLTIMSRVLEEEGYRVSTSDNAFAGLELLSREQIALVLSDLKMPRMDGMEFFSRVREEFPELPFIILTAFATVETALEAIKAGVFDYLMKPFKNEEVLVTVQKALDYARFRSENALLRQQLAQSRDRELLGESPAIRKLLLDIGQVAPARTSILVYGESGTGKELVARALHKASARADGPLIVVNCAALPDALLESELFGHERGAFTGAVERKQGLLEIADGGTLFLDEIGEFPLSLQPKLLRVLQDRRFRRVGGTTELESDIRLVAATNRDLAALIAAGEFREDLYYRLNVVSLRVPSLRERSEDIPLLAFHFLHSFAREMGRPVHQIDSAALRLLQNHAWPGNVRELQNVIERGVLFCNGDTLLPEHLPETLGGGTTRPNGPMVWAFDTGRTLADQLEHVEWDLICKALVRARGVQAHAAELLGISRSNLQYKLKKYHLL